MALIRDLLSFSRHHPSNGVNNIAVLVLSNLCNEQDATRLSNFLKQKEPQLWDLYVPFLKNCNEKLSSNSISQRSQLHYQNHLPKENLRMR